MICKNKSLILPPKSGAKRRAEGWPIFCNVTMWLMRLYDSETMWLYDLWICPKISVSPPEVRSGAEGWGLTNILLCNYVIMRLCDYVNYEYVICNPFYLSSPEVRSEAEAEGWPRFCNVTMKLCKLRIYQNKIIQKGRKTKIKITKRWLKHKGNSRNLVSRLSRETINSSTIYLEKHWYFLK